MLFCGGIGAEILLPSAIGRLSAPQGSWSWRSFNAVVICRSRISCFCVRARPAPRRSRCRARACGRTFGPRRTPAPPIPPWKAFSPTWWTSCARKSRSWCGSARPIQLDAPHYALLLDPATRSFYESQGWSAERYLERGIEMDNAVIGDFPGVTFGFHLCRGNQDSRWLASGGYERIARTVFRHIRAQRLLLEYDDARSGSFEPLKEVPEDKLVVLGLITTKRPRLESMDELESRIREASRFVPLERLAVSPQCGFSSSVIGNAITPADQERKLSLVVKTARQVWGEDAPWRSSS